MLPGVLVLFRIVSDFFLTEAVTRSAFPSPSRSPNARPQGPTSVVNVLMAPKDIPDAVD